MYCVDGVKGSDFCESGGICLSGASTPFGTGTYVTGQTTGTYECPIGSYCVKPGESKPNTHLSCPAGKYTYNPGSTKLDDCMSCIAGFYCASGAAPVACAPGQYCPKGSLFYRVCPMYFYNPLTNGENERACLPCAAGYYCDQPETGVLTVADECSDGYFCPEGTEEEIPCPAGTYRVKALGSPLG